MFPFYGNLRSVKTRNKVFSSEYFTDTVIVEATDKAEAEKLALNVAYAPEGITDIDGNPIEGVGDLVWKYDGLRDDAGSKENSENPVVAANVSPIVKDGL